MKIRALIIAAFVTTIIPLGATQAVPLQQGTATYSQTFGHNFYPAEAIDGILQTSSSSTFNGWAIFSGSTSAQTFATETVSDITTPHVEIKLHFNHDRFFSGSHLIGRFRISVTDDDRALFCDGLPSGGDVDANWTVVTPSAVTLPSGMTYSLPGDGSFLVSGTIPQTGVYTFFFYRPIPRITGFRLEAMEDPSLPTNGPGLNGTNGNFVVSEFAVQAVPHKVTAFTIAPSGVVSGNEATGVVTISAPAPVGGIEVTLTPLSAVLLTPPTLTVPEGQTSAAFQIGTTVTSVEIMRQVRASLNGSRLTRNLIVLLPDITTVNAVPKTLVGGQSSLGTITANGTAGNGFDVNLSSSGPQVMVPSVVTFNYGGRSKTFTINTLVVSATVVKVITATRNGRTRTVTITVTRA